MLKHEALEGIKGVIFDCYNTLIDIKTDDDSIDTYRQVSNWLIYQSVKIDPEELMTEYKKTSKEVLESRWGKKSRDQNRAGVWQDLQTACFAGYQRIHCWSGGSTRLQGGISKTFQCLSSECEAPERAGRISHGDSIQRPSSLLSVRVEVPGSEQALSVRDPLIGIWAQEA